MASYRKLVVWQKSLDLVEEIYRLVKVLPKEELYGISDQMRRAVVSIPSNIAEGQGRNSSKEFARFLAIAQGSRAELETQMLICIRLGYLREDDISTAMSICEEIGKMLRTMIRKLTTTNY